ncbi:hypothetical protein N7G274_008346 [Stereocaulon virgatum]|uniref:Cytochrome b5 heme-binding domain-containing protein n=1 Tax=Stereocaulon virgatum TaxID=373712 RepID=A0ABR4A229_9LECA
MSSSTLRSRTNLPTDPQHASPTTPSTNSANTLSKAKAPTLPAEDDTTPTRLTPLDILRVLAGLLLLSSTLSYFITGTSLTWNYRPAFTRPARIKAWLRGPLHLTDAQLSLYNGTDPNLPILLAVNGSIYDVSAAPHYYGPGGMYSFFAGRDATRAFVTGCFEEDLNGDLRGVEEMFVSEELLVGEREGGYSREEKRERKLRREREWRVARRRVEDTVRGWEALFDGGKGGRYFWVGRVEGGGREWVGGLGGC